MQPSEYVKDAVEQANRVYKEASTGLEQINALFQAIPVEDALHSQDVRVIREQLVQAKDMAIQVLHDLGVLKASMEALENVRGK